MKNNSAAAAKSSAKERANEKTYRISVSTGIFEHCPDMLDSVWLFLWYIDRTTEESNGEGRVLGGMPIVDSRPANELRMPVKTIRRWRLHLEEKGYIRIRRTSFGHVVTLLKSKKWDWRPTLVGNEKKAPRSDLPKGEITPKEISHSGRGDFPKRAVRFPDSGRVISRNGKYKEDKAETRQRQSSRQDSAGSLKSASPIRKATTTSVEWTAIGIQFPVGSATFKASWRAWYVENEPRADSLVWLMEEFIQKCQAQAVAVPPPFFVAKRRVERAEASGESGPSGDRSAEPSRPAVQI